MPEKTIKYSHRIVPRVEKNRNTDRKGSYYLTHEYAGIWEDLKEQKDATPHMLTPS